LKDEPQAVPDEIPVAKSPCNSESRREPVTNGQLRLQVFDNGWACKATLNITPVMSRSSQVDVKRPLLTFAGQQSAFSAFLLKRVSPSQGLSCEAGHAGTPTQPQSTGGKLGVPPTASTRKFG